MPIDSLKLAEAIELAGRIRGGGRAAVRQRTAELVEALELDEWRGTIGMKLSGGATPGRLRDGDGVAGAARHPG
jgi:ABC-2 type transport system ATP-binding protein